MKVAIQSFSLGYKMAFSPPAVELAVQGGSLLELLVEKVGTAVTLHASDIYRNSSPVLDDCKIRLRMFNGHGELKISPIGFDADFTGLTGEADVAVVINVTQLAVQALSLHSPTRRYTNESFSGFGRYLVSEGQTARSEYFSKVSFPGRTTLHEDVSFKTRIHDRIGKCLALFEVAPSWTDETSIFVNFNVDTTSTDASTIQEKSKVVGDILRSGLSSFDLQTGGDSAQNST